MVNSLMRLVFVLSVLLLSGCVSDSSLQFYMLSAEGDQADKQQALPVNKGLVVGLGPIHLPEYLDRPQIVVETSKNQFRLDEHHRWAERLDQNMGRVLAQLLAGQAGVEQVVRFPWAQKQAMDYQVSIDVLQLHQGADGVSRLQAQWQIKNQDRPPFSRRFDCSVPAKDEADAIVKAQSQCLGRLGMEIVTGLRQLTSEAEGVNAK
ncbi:MAG: PqiC family protein [Methylomonas sp.]